MPETMIDDWTVSIVGDVDLTNEEVEIMRGIVEGVLDAAVAQLTQMLGRPMGLSAVLT